jgi:hypothetical protein
MLAKETSIYDLAMQRHSGLKTKRHFSASQRLCGKRGN